MKQTIRKIPFSDGIYPTVLDNPHIGSQNTIWELEILHVPCY